MNRALLLLFATLLFACNDPEKPTVSQPSEIPFFTNISYLNKSVSQIKTLENGELIDNNATLLSFVNKKNYKTEYLFDEKGCYHLGVSAFYSNKSEALQAIENIKVELKSNAFTTPTEDNELLRWIKEDESVRIELDYKNIQKGEIIFTIQANE